MSLSSKWTKANASVLRFFLIRGWAKLGAWKHLPTEGSQQSLLLRVFLFPTFLKPSHLHSFEQLGVGLDLTELLLQLPLTASAFLRWLLLSSPPAPAFLPAGWHLLDHELCFVQPCPIKLCVYQWKQHFPLWKRKVSSQQRWHWIFFLQTQFLNTIQGLYPSQWSRKLCQV